MANLKEIRLRIASVNSNMKITQAMKMVSASKFRHASAAIVKMRPYSEALSGILAQVSASLDSYDVNSPYTVVRREEKKMLLVVVTSNKGLCGAFNANVVKFARHLLAGQFAGKNVDIVTIGTKGRDLLARYCPVVADYSHIFDDLTFAASAGIAQKMMDDFAAGVYDRVQIVYNRFKNAATQILTSEEFLPLVLKTGGEEVTGTDFILEPDSASIVEGLLPQSLRLQFFRILRDSVASEHGARMTAMSQATDNAKALSELLTLQYNNARQASITNQIIEIVSAAEALSGK